MTSCLISYVSRFGIRCFSMIILALLLQGCVSGVGGPNSYTSAQSASIEKAKASIKWLQDFPCPVPGATLDVKGMRTPEEIDTAKKDAWSYASNQIAAISSADSIRSRTLRKASQKGKAPTNSLRDDIEELDFEMEAARAKIATALVTWVVANWVEMAKIDPLYPPDSVSAHPLSPYTAAPRELQTMTNQISSKALGADQLAIIPDKYSACAAHMQNQIFEVNGVMVKQRADESSSPAEIGQLLVKYDPMNTGFSATGITPPTVVLEIQRRKKDLENEALRLAEQKRREEEEIRRRDAQAAYEIDLKRANENLPVAKAFIDALTSHNQSQLRELLHDNVSLDTPKGSYSGKSSVVAKLEENSHQRGGGISSPSIMGTQIISVISHPKARLSLFISIQDGLIRQLRIVK